MKISNDGVISIVVTTIFIGLMGFVGYSIKKNDEKREELKRIAAEKEAELKRMEEAEKEKRKKLLEAHMAAAFDTCDVSTDIRNASVNNKNLDVDTRVKAKEILDYAETRMRNSYDIPGFDKNFSKLYSMIDDFTIGDVDAAKASVMYQWNKYDEANRKAEKDRLESAKKEETRKQAEKEITLARIEAKAKENELREKRWMAENETRARIADLKTIATVVNTALSGGNN